MLDCADVYRALRDEGVRFWVGVPDSLLRDLCAYVDEHSPVGGHVIAANEGSAVALAVGCHLGSGELSAVYLQNSGLGNAINPLISLADTRVYAAPMLLIIGWRGEPGRPDEPQHAKMGEVTVAILEALGVPYEVLPAERELGDRVLRQSARAAAERSGPVALLVRKGSFAPFRGTTEVTEIDLPAREQAIDGLLDGCVSPGTAVLATTGKASRELFELRRRRGESSTLDFLMVGSMGHCSQLALGVAMRNPGRPVVCVDGDGAALMHLGGLATIGSSGLGNLHHVVLNNGAHDSVGGQPTVGRAVDFCAVAAACGYRETRGVCSREGVVEAVRWLGAKQGPTFLEVSVRKGARADLGRPTRTLVDAKARFMAALRDAPSGSGARTGESEG